MGRVTERAQAISFLTRVAQQDSTNEDFQGSAEAAVRTLRHAGPAGKEALESLRSADRVKDPDARRLLETVRHDGGGTPSGANGPAAAEH